MAREVQRLTSRDLNEQKSEQRKAQNDLAREDLVNARGICKR